jgi:predicted DNA-binding transcriptional regulator AlpA
MQPEVFEVEDIMRLCGLTRRELHKAISRSRPDVPRPAGHLARHPFWWRAEVEKWVDERDDERPAA